ncbi:MAG: energy-coupling factor ABC transporter ATP-binding protein [Thermodesulfobacteriota bacterium]
MTELYQLQNISKAYKDKDVLQVDSLWIYPGEIVGIYGPNGSGKTTLLRLLSFLDEPSRGNIFFQGKLANPNNLHLRRQVTYLDQSPYLLKRSVWGNVSYGLKLRGKSSRSELIHEILDSVGLPPQKYAKRKWYQLSGGEAQRVALAARLVLRPRVLVLDEPTTNLDIESTTRIRGASLSVREQWGTTIVVASHDLQWMQSISDRCLEMRDGSLSQDV